MPSVPDSRDGRGLPPAPDLPPYRRYSAPPPPERLSVREAYIEVAALLCYGYGLTVKDVQLATGFQNRSHAWRILEAASRRLPLVVDQITPCVPQRGKRPLIWYLAPDSLPSKKGVAV